MYHRIIVGILFAGLWLFTSCKETTDKNILVAAQSPATQEESAILATLNNETKAAFDRDYERWREKWVHEPSVTKIYMDFSDSTFSESVGWDEIDQFVKTFMKEHPEPEPVPKLIDNIDVRLYGSGAWVVYEQQDAIRGLKRETRLMEKVDGQWKIAGMQTTIYGFDGE